MDFETRYEIHRTADYIHSHTFTKVALQFPDELLKDATKVVRALKSKLRELRERDESGEGSGSEGKSDVGLYVMADTTFGSCCVDEVGAAHINAHCVVHYGHTCLSPTSTLPAYFVYGKKSVSAADCAEKIHTFVSSSSKPALILFGLEYAHAMQNIKEALEALTPGHDIRFAHSLLPAMVPSTGPVASTGEDEVIDSLSGGCRSDKSDVTTSFSIGGLSWSIPNDKKMEDYVVIWIGSDNSAFANVVLTFNSCEIVRYDAGDESLITDVSQKMRILKRRYYFVEKAKDANIVGILVGTLGVAGYLRMIDQMKQLVTRAGKKAYLLVAGRPNPAKLANFPECEVFVYISCAQTALLDSKEFLAPVITPYEAMLAFSRGSQWTGAYTTEFRDLLNLPVFESENGADEPRYSFFQGGYAEEHNQEETTDENDEDRALMVTTDKALRIRDENPDSHIKVVPKSGPEFFAMRTYQGLDINHDGPEPKPLLMGRSGRAAGYVDEKNHDV